MKTKIVSLIFCVMIATQLFAIEPVAKIISQSNAPLTITNYTASYQEGGSYTTEGIRHSVTYKNVSKKSIVAVQIGLVSFDVWNEFMDRTGGIAIEDVAINASEDGVWIARSYADFSFITGFAYVSKVRFFDGIIWEADLEAIAKEMRKIERDFDVKKLKGKPENR